jgi:hypothetical protein
MKTLSLILLFALSHLCLAAGQTNGVPMPDWVKLRENSALAPGVVNTNFIAVSDWSQIVGERGALRARLLLAHLYQIPYSETILYIELQNAENGRVPLQIFYDPRNGLHCKLVDAHGNPPPRMGGGGSGNDPGACWISLPEDATIRLRANTYQVAQILGSPPIDKGDFLSLRLPPSSSSPKELREWTIPAGDTNDYYLSATLTITAPTNPVVHIPEEGLKVFQGTLELPKLKISLKKQ